MSPITRYAVSTGQSVLETSFGEGQQITGAACDLTGAWATAGSLRSTSGLALTHGDRAVSGQASSGLVCGHCQEPHPTAPAPVLLIHVQGWFPLGLAALSSLQAPETLESSPAPPHRSTNSSVVISAYFPSPLSSLNISLMENTADLEPTPHPASPLSVNSLQFSGIGLWRTHPCPAVRPAMQRARCP